MHSTARDLESAPRLPRPQLRHRLRAVPSPAKRTAFSGGVEQPGSADTRRVAAYLAGDPAVFREVDAWIRREIFKRFSSLRNEQEDLSQSVHWRLVIKLRERAFCYRSSLRSYVSGITYHLAMDRLREVYRDRTVATDREPDDMQTTETFYRSLAPLEASRLLDQVIAKAQPGCRALWRMVFLERMTYAEAAQLLSIPPGTVKSRVWHGRRRALALVNERG